MFCPRCGMEYPDAELTCRRCEAALVAGPPIPGHDQAEWVDLVTVLETGDETLLTVIKSLLEAEGVPCLLDGERVQDLVGFGRFIPEGNLATGPVRVQVRGEHEQAARDLIATHDVFYCVASA